MSKAESENPLLVEHEAPLGWMIINRPHKRNALNYQSWQRILEAVEELNSDPDVRVIIMRGVTPEQARAYRSAPGDATNALATSPKPVIAMISGICMGGGVHVALSCDIRIA